MVGQTISHYKIIDELGQGGMGEVYLAEDTKLDRKVALKFLPDFMQQDPVAEKRFLREAKSAAALDHPFICNIYEAGVEDGKSFISMEYVQGENLKDKLEQGPLALKDALEMATEIAEALETAHKANIVHRDLKPSNIMLTPDGHVKVMDFGLAKQLFPSKDVDSQEQAITASLTKTGMTLGTLAYMSPEQLKGDAVDTRSDIFSFGIVLFEMLTSVDPFRKSQPMETASAILKDDPPPLSRYTNEVPPFLERVVGKMLAKEPGQRYQGVHDVATDLQQLLREIAEPAQAGVGSIAANTGEIGVSAATRSWRQMAPWNTAFLGIGIIITLMAVWILTPPPEPRPVTRSTIVIPPTQHLSGRGRQPVALSPNGQQLVYTANRQLYLRSMDDLVAKPIAGTGRSTGVEEPINPFFSPDGRWVGFRQGYPEGAPLKKIPISGGAPVTLCECGGLNPSASWADDGRIVFAGREGIFQVMADGGKEELLIAVNSENRERPYGPQVLPGGEAVLFTLLAGGDEAQIVVHSLDTGERKVLVNGGMDARYVPTGHVVYARGGTLFAVTFDVGSLAIGDAPVPILEGIQQLNSASVFSFSSSGSLVYVPASAAVETKRQLIWVDREGREEPVTEEPRSYRWPRVSPDGQHLAVEIRESGNSDVWIYDLGRETWTPLTFDPGNDTRPMWTPDGRRVVFRSQRDAPGLYWKAADGSGTAKRLTTTPDGFAWSFSPDGSRLLFADSREIHMLSMEGERSSKALFATGSIIQHAMISPDGQWVAYTSNETGNLEVYVQPFPDVEEGKRQISRGGGREPVWSPQGRELFYESFPPGEMMAVSIETERAFTYGSPKLLFTGIHDAGAGVGRQHDIHPDGQRFLMLKEVGTTEETQQEILVVQNWFEELRRLVPTE